MTRYKKKISGRWDIDFVKHPKYQPSGSYIDKYTIAYLITVCENNNEAWKCLKDALTQVEKIVDADIHKEAV